MPQETPGFLFPVLHVSGRRDQLICVLPAGNWWDCKLRMASACDRDEGLSGQRHPTRISPLWNAEFCAQGGTPECRDVQEPGARSRRCWLPLKRTTKATASQRRTGILLRL